MNTRLSILPLLTLTGALLATACSDAVGPAGHTATAPSQAAVPQMALAAPGGSGIALDQFNGTMGASGTFMIKGFNPQNPHRGDAIVATFFWLGSTNIIDSVTDVMTMPGFPRVGNTYRLVEYVTAGGISMATYVGTNVQGFPDGFNGPAQDSILAVEAFLSQPITDGGVKLSAWSGVSVGPEAVAAHRSASGSASTTSATGAGPIPVGTGALAYAITLSNAIVPADPPGGYTSIGGSGSDDFLKQDAEYVVSPSTGTTDPQWTWVFTAPSAWLVTSVSLNPPSHLAFTVQPSRTLPLMTIQPAVQVTVLDALGNPVTSYNGPVTIAIGHNGGLLAPGTLSGTKTVNAVNGVATFSDLSIDQPGNGYTLVINGPTLTGAESAPFNIGAL